MQIYMLLTTVSIATEPKQDPHCGLNGIHETGVGFAENAVTYTELRSVCNSSSINRVLFRRTFLNFIKLCTAKVVPRFRSISYFENPVSYTVYLKMEALCYFETSGHTKLYAVVLCRKLQSMLLIASGGTE